eukprot:487432_1
MALLIAILTLAIRSCLHGRLTETCSTNHQTVIIITNKSLHPLVLTSQVIMGICELSRSFWIRWDIGTIILESLLLMINMVAIFNYMNYHLNLNVNIKVNVNVDVNMNLKVNNQYRMVIMVYEIDEINQVNVKLNVQKVNMCLDIIIVNMIIMVIMVVIIKEIRLRRLRRLLWCI